MSWLSKTFGGSSNYTNPADKAMPYMEQVPGMVDKYYNPYITTGQNAGNTNATIYNNMATDPVSYFNDIMSQFTKSPWATYQNDELTDAASATAASGGYTGTEQDIKNQNTITQGLTSKDQQDWFNNAMGIEDTGLSGNQSLYNTGYNASNSAADANISNLNAEAGLAYKGQENENAYNSSQVNSFMKLLGEGLGMGTEELMKSDWFKNLFKTGTTAATLMA